MLVGLAVAFVLAAGPCGGPHGIATRGAVTAIHVYRDTLAHLWAPLGVRCRFRPTCSHYAEQALERYGLVRGAWLAAGRLLRCGPWTPPGTSDPLVVATTAPAAPRGRASEAAHPP